MTGEADDIADIERRRAADAPTPPVGIEVGSSMEMPVPGTSGSGSSMGLISLFAIMVAVITLVLGYLLTR